MNKFWFFIGAIPPQTGGEIYNYKFFKYLEKEGCDTKCISLHKNLSIRISRIPLIGIILTNIVLCCWLYNCKGVFIEDHYFTKYLFLTNIIHKFIKRGKILVLVHSLYGYDTSDKFLLKQWIYGINHKIRLSVIDIIITNSEYSKKEISSLGIKSELITVIPPGVDRENLQIIAPKENTENSCILCVANYLPGKGLIYLIEAFSQINRDKATLHLVGNPNKSTEYLEKLRTIVESYNLTNNVFFHDGRDRKILQTLYSKSHIFVLPTLKETFGIVLIEAMHYSLPIITTQVGAIPELVIDGENGLLVPPRNSQALADAISKLIDSREIRKVIEEKNHLKVANCYYWEQSFSQFYLTIKKLA